ncbi:MAG TPA: fibronectin type III domain-containing protein [Candidatus Limnocylindria bacterium]|nr:fibronectin type III domain-containing protein [Candidatus Limnocylindria bacterium]
MPERPGPLLPLLAVLLVGCALGVPAPSAELPSATPSVSPVASVASPIPSSTGVASASADASSGASASEAPGTGFDLQVIGCNGGVVLDWTPLAVPAFHHYTALRSPNREIATEWPPIAPAVDWGDTYITDPYVTSAVDASIIPSATRWSYLVVAYDAEDRPIAASPVRQARMEEVDALDRLLVQPGEDGATTLRWAPFDGFSECFSSYRVLATPAGGATSVIAVMSNQALTELETDALHAGTTYRLEVQAVRTATQGSFVVGRAAPVTYLVPPVEQPSASP